MIKRIIRLVVASVIIFVVIKLTTFGFWFNKKYIISSLTDEQNKILSNVKEIIGVLSEDIGVRNYQSYKNLERTADFITKKFKELGYTVEFQTYTINGKDFKNITAYLPSKEKFKEILIVGAHYDSCFNPGADDNASGVAGLIELARLLKTEKTKYDLHFVAFTNEEPPFFYTDQMGSRVYAQWIKEQKRPVKAAIVLEMLGYYSQEINSQRYLPLLGLFYPNRGNFIAVVGNFKSKSLVNKFYGQFKKSSDFPVQKISAPDLIPGIYFSDHSSFWKVGIPSIMISDTAYLRNKNYHLASDTLDKLSLENTAVLLDGLAKSLIDFEL